MTLTVSLRQFRDQDAAPLLVFFTVIHTEVFAIDIDSEDSGLSPSVVLQILHSAREKLRCVDLTNKHMSKDVMK